MLLVAAFFDSLAYASSNGGGGSARLGFRGDIGSVFTLEFAREKKGTVITTHSPREGLGVCGNGGNVVTSCVRQVAARSAMGPASSTESCDPDKDDLAGLAYTAVLKWETRWYDVCEA
eukprot:1178393-Prorocentrum_minimum.AAC.2